MWPEDRYGNRESEQFKDKIRKTENAIELVNILKAWLVQEVYPAYKDFSDAGKEKNPALQNSAAHSLHEKAQNYIGNPLAQVSTLLEGQLGSEYNEYCVKHRLKTYTDYIKFLSVEFSKILENNIIFAHIPPFRFGEELDALWKALTEFRDGLDHPKETRVKGRQKPDIPWHHKNPPPIAKKKRTP